MHARNQPEDLFAALPSALERLPLPDADIHFKHRFFDATFCAEALGLIHAQTAWRHEQITFFGKPHWQPRLVAAHGDANLSYT